MIYDNNNTMRCPLHGARKYTKDMHGIDGSMGEFDRICAVKLDNGEGTPFQ